MLYKLLTSQLSTRPKWTISHLMEVCSRRFAKAGDKSDLASRIRLTRTMWGLVPKLLMLVCSVIAFSPFIGTAWADQARPVTEFLRGLTLNPPAISSLAASLTSSQIGIGPAGTIQNQTHV